MKITDYIENLKKQRSDLSFAFLAERCPTSGDAPFRIKPSSPVLPEENCVLVLAGRGKGSVDLRGYNSILKKTDNFIKTTIDTSDSPVRVCVAVCCFGKKHFPKIAQRGAYYEAYYPQSVNALKHDVPAECVEETFNPLFIKDIFEATVLPRLVSADGNTRLPLCKAQQNIRRLNIVAHCHGAYVAMQLEKLMDKKMNELGYQAEEQSKIKSQLLILAYNPNCPKYFSKSRFIAIESARDSHNEYQTYLREWLLMVPKDFGVCFIPKIYGQSLMCAQVDKAGVEGNPKRACEVISTDEWFKRVCGACNDKVETLGEHDFLGFEPVSNMSKGALKLQCFANNILKNAVKNSQKQSGEDFVSLPAIQNLATTNLQQKYDFAKAAITGCKLMRQMNRSDRSKIDDYANMRRSIPTIELD